MDPITMFSLLGLGTQGAASILSLIMQGKSDEERKQILDSLQKRLGDIQTPEYQQLTSQESKVAADPQLKAAQMAALNRLQGVVDGGGLDLNARAQLNQALGQANQQAQAGQQSILNSMAARGTGGSGAELAAMLSNQQASAQRGSQLGLNAAAQAQQRALQAMQQYGAMAGSMRGQDFSEKSAAARAADLMNQYNNKLLGQSYEDQMRKYGAYANIAGQRIGESKQNAQAWGNAISGIGQAASQGANAYGRYMSKQPKTQDHPTISYDPYNRPYRAPDEAYTPALSLDDEDQ